MKNKSLSTPNKKQPEKMQMIVIIVSVALTVACIVGISWAALSLYRAVFHNSAYETPEAKQRFSTLNAEVEKFQHEIMDPAGAVREGLGEVRGSGDGDTAECSIDVHCPTIGRLWFVPINPGGELQFLTATLQKMGYEVRLQTLQNCKATEANSCTVLASKGQFDLNVAVSIPRSSDKLPTNSISPKVWRSVSVRFNYFWENAK